MISYGYINEWLINVLSQKTKISPNLKTISSIQKFQSFRFLSSFFCNKQLTLIHIATFYPFIACWGSLVTPRLSQQNFKINFYDNKLKYLAHMPPSFTLDRAVATERNMHRLNPNFLAKNAINFNRYDLSYSQNDTILCFDSGTEDKNRLLLFSSSCSALLILRRQNFSKILK